MCVNNRHVAIIARARQTRLAGGGKYFRYNNEASTAVSLDIGRPQYYFIIFILLPLYLCYFIKPSTPVRVSTAGYNYYLLDSAIVIGHVIRGVRACE